MANSAENSQTELEARLKKQEAELQALKAQIVANGGESSSGQAGNSKSTWSLGLSDEESDHDDADKLLGQDLSQENGN